MPTYAVFLKHSASKALGKFPRPAQRRLLAAIEELAKEPRPKGAKRLSGQGNRPAAEALWRIREGEYRIIYQVDGAKLVVLVVGVGNRKDVYEKLLRI